jgi:hypothetical protein
MTIISDRCSSNVLINRFGIAMVKVLGTCDQIGILQLDCRHEGCFLWTQSGFFFSLTGYEKHAIPLQRYFDSHPAMCLFFASVFQFHQIPNIYPPR